MALLRSAPPGSADPLDMASFPLVPYANRIAQGRYGVDGQSYQLPRNFGDHPHSIHGFGWQLPWQVLEQSGQEAWLAHRHAGDAGWPWPYCAQQHVRLNADALDVTLSVRNLGEAPMPCGLGFHPYFALHAGTMLRFRADTLWLSTPDMLPDRAVPADTLGHWSQGAAVAGDSLIDNAYGGWDGTAIVDRGDGIRLTLRAQDADHLHLFRPPGGDFFCLEPVSHMPDAINREQGMAMLAPGATQTLTMTLAVEEI